MEQSKCIFFNLLCKTPMAIFKQVITLSQDFMSAQAVRQAPIPTTHLAWTAPPWGFFKLNTDASFDSHSFSAWEGIVGVSQPQMLGGGVGSKVLPRGLFSTSSGTLGHSFRVGSDRID